jgi:hypothetical protein
MSTIRRSDVDLPLVAITHQQAQLIGLGTDFRNRDGSQMYAQRSGSHGQELFRLGATSHCIVCGMPDIPGVLSFAHIHRRDTHLSPYGDERRVFRLCWGHHHGGYDQNWISTEELLEAEAVWFADTPKPIDRKPSRAALASSSLIARPMAIISAMAASIFLSDRCLVGYRLPHRSDLPTTLPRHHSSTALPSCRSEAARIVASISMIVASVCSVPLLETL